MTDIRSYCVLITSTVVEAVWVLASDAEQALFFATCTHHDGTQTYTQLDCKVTKTEIVGQRAVIQ